MKTQQRRKKLNEGNPEQLRAEVERLGNGELFSTIFQKAAFGIAIADPTGRILMSNPYFQQLLG